MKLNLDDLNPGVFFPFNEDEDGDGGVTIRLANGETLDEISKKCMKKKVIWKRNQRHEVIEENEELRSQLLWNYVIVDWKGLVNDSDSSVIPCTEENKIKLMRGSVQFSGFVGNCVEKLSEESEGHKEELEKN